MTDVPTQERAANAWLVVDAGGTAAEFPYPDYVVDSRAIGIATRPWQRAAGF